jgi:hypothetical protein
MVSAPSKSRLFGFIGNSVPRSLMVSWTGEVAEVAVACVELNDETAVELAVIEVSDVEVVVAFCAAGTCAVAPTSSQKRYCALFVR